MPLFIFTGVLRWTLFAVTTPGLAHCAATVFPGHSAFSRSCTLTTSVIVVTLFLPDVDAPHRVRFVAQLESNWTLADHTTFRIDAPAILADSPRLHAFVHICIPYGVVLNYVRDQ